MNKEILRLAVPNIISNISVPLLSTVDTALMGRMSALHIGAVGIGSMIFNFVYWNFGFLRMGTTGLTAQSYGRRDEKEMISNLGRAFLIALLLGGTIVLLQYPLGEAAIWLMGVGEEQLGLVRRYFYVRVWAAPATLAIYALTGWFFGMQNAVIPLFLTIVVNLVNIALSFFFVKNWGLEAEGVALGTAIAQYVGLVIGVWCFWRYYSDLWSKLQWSALLYWKKLQEFLQLNADIFLRTFLLTFAFGFFYSQSNAEGAMILAVNVILLQFTNWMSYGVDGFAFASESLVGKYAGAGDGPNTSKAIRLSFAWGMGLALCYSLAYALCGDLLLRIFTDQELVIVASEPFLIWVILFPVLGSPCYIWDGVFIGLTASRSMRNAMVLAFAIFLGGYYFFMQNHGNHGLWISLLIFVVARGGFQQYLYWRKGIGLD